MSHFVWNGSVRLGIECAAENKRITLVCIRRTMNAVQFVEFLQMKELFADYQTITKDRTHGRKQPHDPNP